MFGKISFTLLVIGGILFSCLPECGTQVYFVTPTQPPNPGCPSGKPCHTLNYYAKNGSHLLSRKNDVSLLFLVGIHNLSSQNLNISDTVNLTIAALNIYHDSFIKNQNATTSILMYENCSIVIERISTLRMEQLLIDTKQYSLSCIPTINLTLINTITIHNMVYLKGCLAIEMSAKVQLLNSTFNYGTLIYVSNINSVQNAPAGLGSSLYFNNSIDLSLKHSNISDFDISLDNQNTNESSMFNATIQNCNGGVINFRIVEERKFFLGIKNSNFDSFYELSGTTLPGLGPGIQHSYLEINIEDSYYSSYEDFGFWRATGMSPNGERRLFISNCVISDTNIVFMTFFTQISIQNCSFEDDVVDISFATKNGIPLPPNDTSLLLRNVTFRTSTLQLTGEGRARLDDFAFKNCGRNDFVSPLIMYAMDVVFAGESTFSNNLGYRGGSMYLTDTTLFIENGSTIMFKNNTASDVGGAIYVSSTDTTSFGLFSESTVECIFKLAFNISGNSTIQSSVFFRHNFAPNGGGNIYGTSLKSDCPVTPDGHIEIYSINNKVFHFDPTSDLSLSSVSSFPRRVCLCDNGKPQCSSYSHIVLKRHYTPGEKFNLSLVLVGSDFGTVSGGIYAVFNNPGNDSWLGQGQELRRVTLFNIECPVLEYSVHSIHENGVVTLFIVADPYRVFQFQNSDGLNSSISTYREQNEITAELLLTPVFLHVGILSCPLGFSLSSEAGTCQCLQVLVENGIDDCIVVNGTGLVYRRGTVWVSYSVDDNKTEVVLIHMYCPYDYCKTDKISVDLYRSDSQCAFNHSGILCGGCLSNLSLALGSSRCVSCADNGHIALLLVFAIAGIALVLFIKVCNLTVARGSINGLILYANIIWINQSIFFHPLDPNTNQTLRHLFQVLRVFVAWLNLDMGIETCFIQGLDAYWKTWLQFVFPIYIWFLVGGIILLCRYSITATKLFGNNSVHILATLFLLSYVKLLRTIITCLGFAFLYDPEAQMVWLFDGNLQYFGLRHCLLCVGALFALLVLWLPYTLSILFIPCLRKYSNMAWVNKLKPFYDAYYGPLKDKCQYWVGVTLLVRVVLAVTSFAVQSVAPMINVLLVVIISPVLCCTVNHVYKVKYLSALEASFLINLAVLSGGFLYSDNQNFRLALICTSIGISFVILLIIVTVHAWNGITSLLHSRRKVTNNEYENLDKAPTVQQVTRSVVSVERNQLREPLLDT